MTALAASWPQSLRRSGRLWMISALAALVVAMLFTVEKLVSGGIQGGLSRAFIEEFIPWAAWALLAPLVVEFFQRFPIRPDQVTRGIVFHAGAGLLVCILKLFITSPIAAWVYGWGELGISYQQGLRWLLVHRLLANLLLYVLFAAIFHAAYYLTRQRERDAARPTTGPRDVEAKAQPGDPIAIRSGGRVHFVNADDIVRAEADGNYLKVHVGGATHRVRETLSRFEQRLPAGRFIRIHRSEVVNVSRIRVVEPWFRGDFVVSLSDGSKIVSGSSYRRDVQRLVARATGA